MLGRPPEPKLTPFIGERQVAFVEDMIWEQDYLDASFPAAFQLLRSSDLIWSRIVRDYLMGERQPIFLMAGNADSTRMPYRMHSEYFRNFFSPMTVPKAITRLPAAQSH
jgi:polyhydroxyalkanoate synthase subunit PhaC